MAKYKGKIFIVENNLIASDLILATVKVIILII